jgi:ABC-2 type transport system ATP-binding protein
MIEVRGLVKLFGSHSALNGISFEIAPGKITGYLGPNGAGKSTTVKIIAGILYPSEGQVKICGHDVLADSVEARRRIGYVPESSALYSSLTPHEYLWLVSDLYDLPFGLAAERSHQLMAAFAILDVAHRRIATLSKGTRQKVLLTSALIHDPDVLLLDEPLSGLDVNAAHTLRQIIVGMAQRGKTILFCSHILDVVERLCHKVIIIHQGNIVAHDDTSVLLAGNPKGTLEAVFADLTRIEDADANIAEFLSTVRSEKLANAKTEVP